MRNDSRKYTKSMYNMSRASMSDYESRLNIYLLSTGTLPH